MQPIADSHCGSSIAASSQPPLPTYRRRRRLCLDFGFAGVHRLSRQIFGLTLSPAKSLACLLPPNFPPSSTAQNFAVLGPQARSRRERGGKRGGGKRGGKKKREGERGGRGKRERGIVGRPHHYFNNNNPTLLEYYLPIRQQ